MMKRINKTLLVLSFISLLLVSCKKEPHFTIEGVVKDAVGQTLVLERRGISDISIIDSVRIADDGTFAMQVPSPQYPDLYLLRLGAQSINLAVDSIETIKIEASSKSFATGYKVEGSENSTKIKKVVLSYLDFMTKVSDLKNKLQSNTISDETYLTDVQDAISEYKDEIRKLIISDLKSPAAYFALFQKIDGVLIFNPYEKNDSKMYSAVATSWDMYYKESPRAIHLKEFTLRSISERRRSEESANNVINKIEQIDNSDYYNINLPNINGENISLKSLRGKVVLLDFTAYQAEYSPLHNIAINKIYQKYKGDIEVYQVSFDSDIHFWQNASLNLPWIRVHDQKSVTSDLIYKFNLQELPTMFLLNRDGELVKRLSVSDDIEAEIRRLL